MNKLVLSSILFSVITISGKMVIADAVSSTSTESSEPSENGESSVQLESPSLTPPAVKKGKHQLSFGFGLPICAFGAYEGGSGGQCINSEFLWFNVPIVYRHRINPTIAVGGGLMINIFAASEFGTFVGGELVGSLRIYAAKDWLYFGVDILLGFPLFFSIAPSIGHSIKITDAVHIFIENQVPLLFIGGVFGFWQPVLGMEFRF